MAIHEPNLQRAHVAQHVVPPLLVYYQPIILKSCELLVIFMFLIRASHLNAETLVVLLTERF